MGVDWKQVRMGVDWKQVRLGVDLQRMGVDLQRRNLREKHSLEVC